MKTPSRALTLVAIAAITLGLAACGSSSDAPHHDHSDHGAATRDEHGGHDAAGPAMGTGHEPGSALSMKKIPPSSDYPLQTCVVSGEPLGGGMGDPIAYEVDGLEVQFCCEGCVDEFKESPAEFLARVRAARAR